MGSTPVGISASRGAAILGLSEYQTQFEVWQVLMEEREPGFSAARGYLLPERKDSAPLRWGKAFEDAVIALAEEAHDRPIIDRERFYGGPCGDSGVPVTCHIDGMYINEPGVLELHEGKTTSAFPFREKWGEPGTDRVPQTYQVQGQHQLVCTKAGLVIFSVLVFPEAQDAFEKMGRVIVQNGAGEPCIQIDGAFCRPCRDWAEILAEMGYFHQYPVPADPDAQKLLLEAYDHFWRVHVLGARDPELSTYDDVRRAFPEPVGTCVVDDETAGLFAERDAIKDEIGGKGPLAKRADELKVEILRRARTMGAVKDEESEKKIIFRDAQGKKLGQFDGKSFR